MNKVNRTPKDVACGQLAGGAFFYAMRSCEYTKVSGDRRTKLLEIRNFEFFRDNKLMDLNHPELHLADVCVVTSFFQKNDKQDDSVPQHRTFDPVLCPVKCWASVIKRILSYPSTGPNTPINTYLKDGKLCQVSSKMLLDRLRAVINRLAKMFLDSRPTRWARTPSVLVQQWLCTSLMFLSIQSCWLADGRAMPSCDTFANKYKNSVLVSPTA
mmetsp:Transcript_28009/g.50716  ORF Transcript_28009/g.50716 Transcript_28009/m.50716 type:complete len:213 (-) Transcript_28009:511-1149(-)